MIRKFKIWFNTKVLKRQYIMGIDYGNSKDYGYRNKNGVVKITNIKYF